MSQPPYQGTRPGPFGKKSLPPNGPGARLSDYSRPARDRACRHVSPADDYAWTVPPKPRSSTRIRTLLMIMPVQHDSPLAREMIKPEAAHLGLCHERIRWDPRPDSPRKLLVKKSGPETARRNQPVDRGLVSVRR